MNTKSRLRNAGQQALRALFNPIFPFYNEMAGAIDHPGVNVGMLAWVPCMIFALFIVYIKVVKFAGKNSIKNLGKKTEYKYSEWDYYFIGASFFGLAFNSILFILFIYKRGKEAEPTDLPIKIVFCLGIILYYLYGLPAIYNKNKWAAKMGRWVVNIVNMVAQWSGPKINI